MKSKIKRHSRSALAVILTLSMLVSCMMVGLIATDAARVTDSGTVGATADDESVGANLSNIGTVWFDNSLTNWSSVYCFIGHTGYVRAFQMSAETGNNSIYKVDVRAITNNDFSDRTKLFFASSAISGMTDGTNSKNIDSAKSDLTDGHYTANRDCSDTDNGSLFYVNVGTDNAELKKYSQKYVVGGMTDTNNWSNTKFIMNYNDSSYHYYTFNNLSAGTYKFAIFKYNDWNSSYRWSYTSASRGTGCTLSDADDTDHNINVTISAKSNITIYYKNADDNKIYVTATPTAAYYGLIGNVSSEYLASVNGSASTASDGWPGSNSDPRQDNYQAAVGINNAVEGSAGSYSITITTVSQATLTANGHNSIDVGIITTGNVQYGFRTGTYGSYSYYNYYMNNGSTDYTVPSGGVDENVQMYVQAMDTTEGRSPGGALVLQPGTTYTITVNQMKGSNNMSPYGLITVTVDSTTNPPSHDEEVSNSGVYLRGSFDNAVDWATGKQFTKKSGDWLVMDVNLIPDDGTYTDGQNKGVKIYQDSKWRGPNQDSNYGLNQNTETTADGVNKSGNYIINSGGNSRVFYNPTTYKFKYINYSHTYTAFGAMGTEGSSPAGIFGTAWADDATANDMTMQADGTYSIAYEDVPAGTYYYKVAKDHSASTSYPSENQTFTIANGGATVIISIDPSSNEVTHYIVEGPTPPSPGTWTLYYMPDDGAARDEAMTETPAGSGIFKSNNKLDFINGSPNKTKIKFKNGTVFYGPESGSDTNFVAGATNQYNAISGNSGDFVFNGKNGDYYVWVDTNKTGGTVADYFWLEGDEDDTSTPVTTGSMVDTSTGGWSASNEKLVYKDNNDQNALVSANISGITVYTNSNGERYADLTSILDTIKNKSTSFQLAFATNSYSSSSDKQNWAKNGHQIIGYHNSNSARTIKSAYGTNVDSSIVTKDAQGVNDGNDRFYRAIITSVGSNTTQLGLKLTPKGSDDWSTITYTFYGIKTNATSKPTVTVYAKDGMIRSGYQTFSNTADTTIDKLTLIDGTVYDRSDTSFTKTSGSGTFSGSYNQEDYYDKLTSVPKGSKIKFTTALSTLSPKYYVKAFCINGVSYEVYNKNTTGSQTMEWTIPSDFADNYVEITPIYYLYDDSNTKELKVEGFDKTVQSSGWGNTLAVYPYYSGKSSTQNAFGGYPGQPFVFYGGKYFIQIPITHDGTASGAEIRGLTLSNNYWDSRHKSLDSTLNDHRQTYDYDDFFKLYREKNPDTIIVYYKYRVAKDNYGDGYPYEKGRSAGAGVTVKRDKYTTRGGGNGVETYLDYYDRDIDIFSNLITDNNAKIGNDPDNKLLVISNGYVDTFVGDYATEWNIYKTTNGGTSYSYVTSIAPSVLYMNDLNSWDNYSNGSTTGGGKLGSYKSAYTTLQDYKGWGVEISYEKEIRNYSKDQANRLDARWFYSKKTDQIQANVRIEYLSDGRYITDEFTNTNQGTVTNTKAYFTNTSPNIKGQVTSGKVVVNSDKYFTFQAEESSTYKFVGWWLLRGDTYTEITEDMIGKSPMNSNDTYVARFEPMQSGTLSITHVIDPASQGSGTPYLTVTIKDGSNNIVEQFDKATGKTFSNSEYINEAYSSYTVEVALETDADDNSYFTGITNPITKNIPTETGSNIYTPTTGNVTDINAKATKSFTVADILAFANTLSDSDKSKAYNIQYYTTLNKYSYSYEYNITYTYISRFWGKQKFVRTGTIDSDQLPDYITGKQGDARLTAQFLKDQTPCETTFRQLINWNYSDATQSNSASGTTYTITATVNATNTVNDKVTAEYRLPYRFTNTAGTTWAPNPYTGGLLFDESVASDKVTTRIGSLFTTNTKTTDADFYQYDPDVPWTDELAAAHPMVTAAESVYKVTLPEFKFNEYGFALYTGHTEDEYLAILNQETEDTLTAAEIAYFANSHEGNDPYAFSAAHKLSAARELYDKAYSDQYLAAYKAYYADVYTFGTDTSTTRRYSYIEIDGETGAKTEWTDEIDVHTPNITDIKTTDTTKIAQKYFSYWNVTNTKNEFVAKVYSLDFNYSGYDNYFATPVYESNQDEFRALRGQQGTSTTITYLGETRNQWNVYTSDPTKAIDGTDLTGSTIKLASSAGQSADKILEDFALSYVHNGEEISKLSDNVEIGVVVQQLEELDTLNGSYITTPSYYQNKYSGTVAASITQIKALTDRNTTVSSGDAKGVYVKSGLTNGKASLDNKNRLDYYFTFNNHKAVSGTSTTPSEGALRNDRLYAYRAFTYIKIGSDEMVVSAIPAYFTFYDLAMM